MGATCRGRRDGPERSWFLQHLLMPGAPSPQSGGVRFVVLVQPHSRDWITSGLCVWNEPRSPSSPPLRYCTNHEPTLPSQSWEENPGHCSPYLCWTLCWGPHQAAARTLLSFALGAPDLRDPHSCYSPASLALAAKPAPCSKAGTSRIRQEPAELQGSPLCLLSSGAHPASAPRLSAGRALESTSLVSWGDPGQRPAGSGCRTSPGCWREQGETPWNRTPGQSGRHQSGSMA
ncbi:uncharacterized protein LOC120391781 [Mauremys reevesii]|uniref:uncharacterized protein LOC120391781 n=1 Tax=Mauremys reevesii TaxID=260615 RepID=UPI00193FFAF7|nr:uncharacterized protein LOC120391781 [Mauremys reevesii]